MKARLRNESFLDHAGALASVPVSASKDKSEDALDAPETANLKPMQIFFGSNTGTCEAVATALAASAQRKGFKAEPVSMDDGVALFDKSQPVVVFDISESTDRSRRGTREEWSHPADGSCGLERYRGKCL